MLVPVTVTVNVFAIVEAQERVAVPEPVMEPGVMPVHVRPAGTVSVSVTVPEKPLSPVTVIVEVAVVPTVTAAGEVAEIEKSAAAVNTNVAVAEWDSEPLVPVMVTVKVFAVVEEQARVAVPAPEMLAGAIAPHVSPAGTVSARLTVPAKPFRTAMVIVEVAEDPVVVEGDVAATVKSTKLKVAVVE